MCLTKRESLAQWKFEYTPTGTLETNALQKKNPCFKVAKKQTNSKHFDSLMYKYSSASALLENTVNYDVFMWKNVCKKKIRC